MTPRTYRRTGTLAPDWFGDARPFPRDDAGRVALAQLVELGCRVMVRYDNGQLCTFRRVDPS